MKSEGAFLWHLRRPDLAVPDARRSQLLSRRRSRWAAVALSDQLVEVRPPNSHTPADVESWQLSGVDPVFQHPSGAYLGAPAGAVCAAGYAFLAWLSVRGCVFTVHGVPEIDLAA
jgi:hypothetical protein